MAYSIDELKWQSLTAAINKIKAPQNFLKRLLFGREVTLSTETIEMSYLTGARDAAPFVRKNGEALMVEGLGETFATVEAPNIRIKRPMTPSDLLFRRRPGTVIFVDTGSQMSAIQAHIGRDLKRLRDLIANSEEWMSAMAIRGTVTYSVNDQENFTITFPKPSAHTFTASPLWSTTSNPEEDVLTAARLIADDTGLTPTHAICGLNAAKYFRKNARVETILDNRRIMSGEKVYTGAVNEQGAIFMGTWCGLEWWEYSRSVNLDGTSTKLVRDDYVEIVTATPAADNVTYYGAIPDMDALQGRMIQSKIFSKSWIEKDPSVMWALAHSRPLTVPRLPGSMVSIKVSS
jgi:hypothetical protein